MRHRVPASHGGRSWTSNYLSEQQQALRAAGAELAVRFVATSDSLMLPCLTASSHILCHEYNVTLATWSCIQVTAESQMPFHKATQNEHRTRARRLFLRLFTQQACSRTLGTPRRCPLSCHRAARLGNRRAEAFRPSSTACSQHPAAHDQPRRAVRPAAQPSIAWGVVDLAAAAAVPAFLAAGGGISAARRFSRSACASRYAAGSGIGSRC